MTSMLSRSTGLLLNLQSHHANNFALCLRTNETVIRDFSSKVSQDDTNMLKMVLKMKGPKDNRFDLPGQVGLSWKVETNYKKMCLPELVDILNMSKIRLHIKIEECPYLVAIDLEDLFPKSISPKSPATIITLSYEHFDDDELGRQYFYKTARFIQYRLNAIEYETNFINPYTGKPNNDYSELLPMFKTLNVLNNKPESIMDDRFKNAKSTAECVYIKSYKGTKIGKIYTTATEDVIWRSMM